MSDFLQVTSRKLPKGKRGKMQYQPSKGADGKGSYNNWGGPKKAQNKKHSMVDKKVKKVSNKVMGLKGKQDFTPPAAYSRPSGYNSNR